MKLPKGILKSDLKLGAKAKGLTPAQQKKLEALNLKGYLSCYFPSLDLLDVETFGWTIPTLLISKASRGSAYSDRSYAITLDGKMCRVGQGPHVKSKLRIYVSKDSFDRLFPILELFAKGLASASQTRDRISTRRMRGYL